MNHSFRVRIMFLGTVGVKITGNKSGLHGAALFQQEGSG